MHIHSPLLILAACGLLSAAGTAAAQDTSAWKCESCPYPKGSSGSIEAGVGVVSDASAAYGDHTGLQRKGVHLVLGGQFSQRQGDFFADITAADLGLDTRRLQAQGGHEGLFTLRLGYAEDPRHLADGAATPFLGNGGSVLTLPAGYPAASTASMPLGSTLQPIDLGARRTQFDLGASVLGGQRWVWRASVRRDVLDGTRPTSASFFITAAQMAAPVDQVTDQFELSSSYTGRAWSARVAYQLSSFNNQNDSLRWQNPFNAVVPGATTGQLALAPDNRFQQVSASVAWQVDPTLHASGDLAVGRIEQDAAFLASTLTPSVAATVPALPATSLGGRVDTLHAAVRLSAAPSDALRVNAMYARDVRDNRTPLRSFPQVATDMFLDLQAHGNTAFDITQDRFKLSADYRARGSLRLSAAVEKDERMRTYTEVVTTRENTVWARVSVQPDSVLKLALKAAHAERIHSPYGTATWFGAPENPLLRKYNLAGRERDSASLRADITASEKVGLGFTLDLADDAYTGSLVGLQRARSTNITVDVSVAWSEATQISAFAQTENIRSRQAGSSSATVPDWSGRTEDRFNLLGLGLRHALIADKLDVGADLSVTRARSQVTTATVLAEPDFPVTTTANDTLRLFASYKLSDKLIVNGSFAHARQQVADWRLDGIAPGNLGNLLAFGTQAPNYRVDLLRVSVRYLF